MPRIVFYGCALLLLFALLPMPYGYYTLVRITSTLVFGYLALQNRENLAFWGFSFAAILFNPFIPIHFPKSFWELVDIAAAIVLIVNAKNARENT